MYGVGVNNLFSKEGVEVYKEGRVGIEVLGINNHGVLEVSWAFTKGDRGIGDARMLLRVGSWEGNLKPKFIHSSFAIL